MLLDLELEGKVSSHLKKFFYKKFFKLAFEFFAVGAFFLHFIFFVVKSDGVFFVK